MVAHVTHRELWWTSGCEAWSSVACGVRFMCNKNQFKGSDHMDRSAVKLNRQPRAALSATTNEGLSSSGTTPSAPLVLLKVRIFP